MSMLARVSSKSTLKTVTACAGMTFTMNEWLAVPLGMEEEVVNHPMLEFKIEGEHELKKSAPQVIEEEGLEITIDISEAEAAEDSSSTVVQQPKAASHKKPTPARRRAQK